MTENIYLKRTRLSSLTPSGKETRVMYTPGSSCTVLSDFCASPLVPLDSGIVVELSLDALLGDMLVTLLPLDGRLVSFAVCSLLSRWLQSRGSSGALSDISFNCKKSGSSILSDALIIQAMQPNKKKE